MGMDDNLPRMPRNYKMTPYGIITDESVSEEARELYSNYFMVRESLGSEVRIYDFSRGFLQMLTCERRDYENPDDFSQRVSSAHLELIIEHSGYANVSNDGPKEELAQSLEPYLRERKARLNHKDKDFAIYSIGNDINNDMNNDLQVIVGKIEGMDGELSTLKNRYSMMRISREANEHILDTTDRCFAEMSRYRTVLEGYGMDWDDVEDRFYSLSYDDLPKVRILDEIPRDSWESPREAWGRLGKEGLEDVADALLGLYGKPELDAERKKELRDSLDHVRRLLKR